MTSVVPATAGDADDPAAAEPQEGASSLSDTQRRWCIGAAVVVMGLASLGTALYQTSSSEVDPSADAQAIAPLETSTSGSDAAPAAGVPGGAYGLPGGAYGAPSADALPPLSLLPGGAAGALPPSGGIPSSAGVPDYVSPAPAQPRVVDSTGLGPQAAPPLASLPAGGATAPSAAGTAAGSPGAAGTASASGAGASPYRQTETPGVIEVAPGAAPPPGYQRVYKAPPRQQAAPGTTQQRSRTTPDAQGSTPGSATSPQRRTTPGTTSESGRSTSPSGSSTAPSGRTAPRSQQPGLLGGLGN